MITKEQIRSTGNMPLNRNKTVRFALIEALPLLRLAAIRSVVVPNSECSYLRK